MAYVERNQEGKIIAVHDTAQENAEELVSINDEELHEFLRQADKPDAVLAALSASDIGLIRVLEDLVNTLIEKNIIMFTDLPLPAQEKLANREKIRGNLSSLANLMGDDTGIL